MEEKDAYQHYNDGFKDGYNTGFKERERINFYIIDGLRLQIEHLKLDLEDQIMITRELTDNHSVQLKKAYERGLYNKRNS